MIARAKAIWGEAGVVAFAVSDAGGRMLGEMLAWDRAGRVGCCWALMASLFALGVMSIAWMALVASLIAVEKTLPWRRTATYSTAVVLVALGLLLVVTPEAVPGLTIPGQNGSMMDMDEMGP